MQALILAGGQGTRLRPLTLNLPKPVVPICNRPFLLYQIETLRRAGITDITLSLSYQPHRIEEQLGDGSDYGVKLTYTVEPQPMGTAGAYKFAADFIREPTVVFNGDILTDLDLAAVVRAHEERRAAATIVLTPVENPRAYGLVERHEDGRVRRFIEKPKTDAEITTNNINAGTYVLDPRVLDYIPAGENYSFEYGLFPDLLRRGEPFFAHVPTDAYWIDIGTPERYLQVHHDLLAGRVRGVEVERGAANFSRHDSADIDDLSLVGDGCVVAPGARVTNSVLGDNCRVEEGAVVTNSVLWPLTQVGAGAHVTGAVTGRNCRVGRNVRVGAGAVLGDDSSLTDFTQPGGAL